MGLSLALNTARSSLLATSSQIAVNARNVAGANDPSYARRIATLVTGGGSAAVAVTRAGDAALFSRKLSATSDAARGDAVLAGLKTLSQTVGDTADKTSPAARLGQFTAALQAAANQPDDTGLARTALDGARDLAGSLRGAAEAVHAVRAEADRDIAASVERINGLLDEFGRANAAVIRGGSGLDVTDAQDDRDRVLAALSQELGITTVTREGGDVAIYTDGGVPLFERTARSVAFAPTAAFGAGTAGNAVFIDGVPVTGDASPMPLVSGRLAGLASLRDGATVQYEAQLDAIAGALVEGFSEAPTPAALAADPTLTTRAGLFTTAADGALPAAGAGGLAARSRLNAAVDPAQGGAPTLLRDGGMNGTAYRDPEAGAAAFSGRLRDLADALGARRGFDPGTELRQSATVAGFAAASAGWLEGQRKTASSEAEYQQTLLTRAGEALSNAVGVNGDDEIALTLQLEQSYTASAKLITVVNELLRTLLDAVR